MIDEILNIPKVDIVTELFKRRDFDFITVRDGLKHEKQEKALNILTDKTHAELFYGGAAGGAKSWTGSAWVGLSALAYPETKWFIARDELKTLLGTTYITFLKTAKAYGFTDSFRYDGKYNYLQFKNGSRVDLLDLKYLPNEDPLYERYGSSEYTGGWIDEAGQVHVNAYDILKSRVGRHLNDLYGLLRKLLLTANPKKNFIYREFYIKWKQGHLEPHKEFIKALLHDNPFRESGYEEALLQLSNKATKERLLKGNFEYDDDPAALIDYDSIINIFTGDWLTHSGDNYITADIARFGKDSTVIGVWNGFGVEMFDFHGLSVTESAEKIKFFQEKFMVPNDRTIADEDGVGGGVVDILKCRGFVNNKTALPSPEKPEYDEKGNIKPENYTNLKSQCYFRMANRICNGGMYVKCDDTKRKDLIIEELEQVKQHNMDKDGKRQVLPKDKVKEIIGRSPDYSDTLMMREYFELAPKFTWTAF